jgi:hypothetical protein
MLGSSGHHSHFYFNPGKNYCGTASTRKPATGRGGYGSALGIAGTTLLATVQNACLDFMCHAVAIEFSNSEAQIADGLEEVMISLCSLSY